MSIDVRIVDGRGNRYTAHVTPFGQLVAGPLAFDLTKFQKLDAVDTAFNFYSPSVGEQFIVTGIRIKAGRTVSNTVDAEVIIYEASSSSTATVDRTVYEDALIRGEFADFVPINILINEGKFVNAKTDDATMFINIVGYYVPVTE